MTTAAPVARDKVRWMRRAYEFEAEVINKLVARGWITCAWGQGLMPRKCIDLLQCYRDDADHPSILRFIPDVFTGHYYRDGGVYLALVDAKTAFPMNGDSPNYSINEAALKAAEYWNQGTPTFFVFDNWQVMAAHDVRRLGHFREGGPNNGSGKPFFLVAKTHGRPFASVFPMVRP